MQTLSLGDYLKDRRGGGPEGWGGHSHWGPVTQIQHSVIRPAPDIPRWDTVHEGSHCAPGDNAKVISPSY